MIKFTQCGWNEIRNDVADYFAGIIVDSYWEDHVIDSRHYKMTDGGEAAGWFAVHKESAITLFHVYPRCANQSQELFARVKKYEKVTGAMVTTGDEFFLSHCVDSFSRMEKQAYFSVYTDKGVSNPLPLSLRLADIDADAAILKLSGDFLDGEIEKVRGGADYLRIYIAELEGRVAGFGVMEYGRVLENIASIGMYVCEEYRRRGIGANILHGLRRIAGENGCTARSGCWYYNHNSKKTMESAGAYSKARLLRFYF